MSFDKELVNALNTQNITTLSIARGESSNLTTGGKFGRNPLMNAADSAEDV